MRLNLAIVLTSLLVALLMATACQSTKSPAPVGYQATVGKVLAASDGGGSVVVSLGTRDGVRPGDSLIVVRNGREVGQIIIHEANATQAAGTAVGGSGAGDVAVGDAVIGR